MNARAAKTFKDVPAEAGSNGRPVPKICGLIAGRHKMPVNEYIFSSGVPDRDCLSFDKMERTVKAYLLEHGLIVRRDGKLHSTGQELVVYITGLTSAAAAVVTCCCEAQVPLSFMHYDKKMETYRKQEVLRGI